MGCWADLVGMACLPPRPPAPGVELPARGHRRGVVPAAGDLAQGHAYQGLHQGGHAAVLKVPQTQLAILVPGQVGEGQGIKARKATAQFHSHTVQFRSHTENGGRRGRAEIAVRLSACTFSTCRPPSMQFLVAPAPGSQREDTSGGQQPRHPPPSASSTNGRPALAPAPTCPT